MLWLARFTPRTTTRARAALALTLIAAVACADRVATDPVRATTQRALADATVNPFDDLWVAPHRVIVAGNSSTGTITLKAPAPAGGAHIVIKLAHPGELVASVDSIIFVPPGATSANFVVQTRFFTHDAIGVGIYADWDTWRAQTSFAVFPGAVLPPPPSISVSPGNLTFGSQAVGTSSASQVVTVRNTGTVTLNLGVIGVSGPFAQTNNCPSTLAPNLSCSIWVVYAATGAGAQSGSLTVPSNAPNSPSVVILNGTGFVPTPAISITPASIGFGGVPLGTATSGRVVIITSTGTAPLVVSSLTLGGTNPGDFSVSDGCTGVSLSPGASCTARVSFEPARIGTRTATVTIAHNATGGPAAVSLSGAGVKGAGGYIP